MKHLIDGAELIQEKSERKLFFSTYMLLFMCFAFFWPYLSAHFANLGIDSGRIGILVSIGSVVTIFVLPIWSRISDSTGNRRAVLKIIAIGSALSILLFIVSETFWSLFFRYFYLQVFMCVLLHCLTPLSLPICRKPE